ncbi:MAG: RNA polymerase-associated protein RapA, partial [Pseudomonadales bacterium]
MKVGQKWISNAEPELGMGRITAMEQRTVSVYFDLASEERRYAIAQAPLTRVRFNPGDEIATRDNIRLAVTRVIERDGLFVYHGTYLGTDTAVIETELDANVRFSKPEDRLFTRQIDDNRWFNLRYHSLQRLAALSQSPSRGLYGPRVSLIPHQLYIANEVAVRFAPRVLLADEVGLGKTIEAGLIIHQQLQTGRASRALIIVPPALTFQWFVEMIRRFNLHFTVMDEDRCDEIIADNDEIDSFSVFNPFEAQQLMLCSLDLFTNNPDRLDQVLDAPWDLVVVDEAHHLEWSPTNASQAYTVVDLISRASRGLLLLTATPEQLGHAGHFARLRLLDPDRFHDYDAFVAEEEAFEDIVAAVDRLLDGSGPDKVAAREAIAARLGAPSTATDDELIRALLDRHGTGRVLFRNVRSSVKGFPTRVPKSHPLTAPDAYQRMAGESMSFFPETLVDNWTRLDPRVNWLIELATTQANEKFLVICAHQEIAISLEKTLRERTPIRTTVFHEGMDLIERDRAATYFAETDRGAQLLVCSEIGSEGRNFQFASHLVLFDLPLGPDLLEQRIGRLDRIGQLKDVIIHIPYLKGTPGADLYRWYAEGVNAFNESNPVAQSLFEQFGHEIGAAPIEELVTRTRKLNTKRREEVNRGRDRLLEFNSHNPAVSSALVNDINEREGGAELEAYME